jgi:hypothetical protein
VETVWKPCGDRAQGVWYGMSGVSDAAAVTADKAWAP